jgi:hypothetical protein
MIITIFCFLGLAMLIDLHCRQKFVIGILDFTNFVIAHNISLDYSKDFFSITVYI